MVDQERFAIGGLPEQQARRVCFEIRRDQSAQQRMRDYESIAVG